MGKLIVLYGINNLGKSTQAKLLVDKLNSIGKKAAYLKYLIYDLKPSGPLINEYLRGGNPWQLTPREFQILGAYNKAQFNPKLQELLDSGTYVVAEDYWGTGVAWGIGAGVDKQFLLKLHESLIHEDLAFLFTGNRFMNSLETGHLHETNDALMEKVKFAHEELAKEYDWKRIDANQSIEQVSESIWQQVQNII